MASVGRWISSLAFVFGSFALCHPLGFLEPFLVVATVNELIYNILVDNAPPKLGVVCDLYFWC